MSLNGQFDHEEAEYEAWLDELNQAYAQKGLDAVAEIQHKEQDNE